MCPISLQVCTNDFQFIHGLAFQMMYAGTKLSLVKEADLTKVFEIRDLEELTDEWLKLKLLK